VTAACEVFGGAATRLDGAMIDLPVAQQARATILDVRDRGSS